MPVFPSAFLYSILSFSFFRYLPVFPFAFLYLILLQLLDSSSSCFFVLHPSSAIYRSFFMLACTLSFFRYLPVLSHAFYHSLQRMRFIWILVKCITVTFPHLRYPPRKGRRRGNRYVFTVGRLHSSLDRTSGAAEKGRTAEKEGK